MVFSRVREHGQTHEIRDGNAGAFTERLQFCVYVTGELNRNTSHLCLHGGHATTLDYLMSTGLPGLWTVPVDDASDRALHVAHELSPRLHLEVIHQVDGDVCPQKHAVALLNRPVVPKGAERWRGFSHGFTSRYHSIA